MATLTVENYVKTVYKLCEDAGDHRATTGRVAAAMGVSPGTVTSMLKTLSEQGLATYTPYEGVCLTEEGSLLALTMLRRHRLIELFLTNVLDLEWEQVHDEAEQLEHAMSDRLIERIDDYLGHPGFDPHGDPIPGPRGEIADRDARKLAACAPGNRIRLARVLDQSPEFLCYLTQVGLRIGIEGRVLPNPGNPTGVTVQFNGEPATLTREVAERLLVEVRPSSPLDVADRPPAAGIVMDGFSGTPGCLSIAAGVGLD